MWASDGVLACANVLVNASDKSLRLAPTRKKWSCHRYSINAQGIGTLMWYKQTSANTLQCVRHCLTPTQVHKQQQKLVGSLCE